MATALTSPSPRHTQVMNAAYLVPGDGASMAGLSTECSRAIMHERGSMESDAVAATHLPVCWLRQAAGSSLRVLDARYSLLDHAQAACSMLLIC